MENVPISTFPFPASEADLNQLADHLTAIQEGQRQVIGDVQQGMTSLLVPIEQDYSNVNTRINRTIGATMRPVNAGYEGVINQLAQSVLGETAEIGVQTNLISSMVPYIPQCQTSPNSWVIYYDIQGGQVAAICEEAPGAVEDAINHGWVSSELHAHVVNMTPVGIKDWLIRNMAALQAEIQQIRSR